MSDSEYEDFGSGDESFDEGFDDFDIKPEIIDDEEFENLKCKIMTREVVVFMGSIIKKKTPYYRSYFSLRGNILVLIHHNNIISSIRISMKCTHK